MNSPKDLSKARQYLDTMNNLELRLTDDQEYYRLLDTLWGELSEEEIAWVEELFANRIIPEAPQSLEFTDQSVAIGESKMPRNKNL